MPYISTDGLTENQIRALRDIANELRQLNHDAGPLE